MHSKSDKRKQSTLVSTRKPTRMQGREKMSLHWTTRLTIGDAILFQGMTFGPLKKVGTFCVFKYKVGPRCRHGVGWILSRLFNHTCIVWFHRGNNWKSDMQIQNTISFIPGFMRAVKSLCHSQNKPFTRFDSAASPWHHLNKQTNKQTSQQTPQQRNKTKNAQHPN